MTPKFVHGAVAGAFVGLLLVTAIRASSSAQALSISSVRDCGINSVIDCGALSTSELQSKYKDSGVAQIYSASPFNITAGDINDIGKTAVAGLIYRNGNVTVNGKVVATDAISAGRMNIPSSKTVTNDGVTFYERPPSVSYDKSVNSIAGFVVMSGGQFKFAIMAPCSNPVSAIPVPKPRPTPTPTPKPPVHTPKPKPSPTPTPTIPISTVASPPTPITPTSLPNTGPGAVVIIAIASVAGGYVFHMGHRHIRNKRRTTHHHATHHPKYRAHAH